jgi:signal peptidase II
MDDSSTADRTAHDDAPGPDLAGAPRLLLPVLLAAVALTVLAVDQLTKYLAVSSLTENVPVPVIDGILQFRLIRNSGAAFSLATGMTWILTLIAVAVTVAIVRIARRLGSLLWALALGLLLGGAVGNLTDRLLRAPGFALGHVVDFIEYLKFPFISFPVFNVADSCIVVSAFLIGLLTLRGIAVDGSRPGR